MIYFCADDYGISSYSNARIEECLKNGVLNKISILPNGNASDFSERLFGEDVELSLHLNLIEGYPLSKKEDVSLLVSEKGFFKYIQKYFANNMFSLKGEKQRIMQNKILKFPYPKIRLRLQ